VEFTGREDWYYLGVIWGDSHTLFSQFEDLHVAFLLGRICEWRAGQLKDVGGGAQGKQTAA
jgi:hypothetical protein